MIEFISKDAIIKNNIIELVKQHKGHCKGEHCTVSLYFVQELLTQANIELTDEEKKIFI